MKKRNYFNFLLYSFVFIGFLNTIFCMGMERNSNPANESTPLNGSQRCLYVDQLGRSHPLILPIGQFQQDHFQFSRIASTSGSTHQSQTSSLHRNECMQICCENMNQCAVACICAPVIIQLGINGVCCLLVGTKLACGCPC